MRLKNVLSLILSFFCLFSTLKKSRHARNLERTSLPMGTRDLFKLDDKFLKKVMITDDYAKQIDIEKQKILQNICVLMLDKTAKNISFFNGQFLKHLLFYGFGPYSYTKAAYIKQMEYNCELLLVFSEVFLSLNFSSLKHIKGSEEFKNIRIFINEITKKGEFVKKYFEQTQSILKKPDDLISFDAKRSALENLTNLNKYFFSKLSILNSGESSEMCKYIEEQLNIMLDDLSTFNAYFIVYFLNIIKIKKSCNAFDIKKAFKTIDKFVDALSSFNYEFLYFLFWTRNLSYKVKNTNGKINMDGPTNLKIIKYFKQVEEAFDAHLSFTEKSENENQNDKNNAENVFKHFSKYFDSHITRLRNLCKYTVENSKLEIDKIKEALEIPDKKIEEEYKEYLKDLNIFLSNPKKQSTDNMNIIVPQNEIEKSNEEIILDQITKCIQNQQLKVIECLKELNIFFFNLLDLNEAEDKKLEGETKAHVKIDSKDGKSASNKKTVIDDIQLFEILFQKYLFNPITFKKENKFIIKTKCEQEEVLKTLNNLKNHFNQKRPDESSGTINTKYLLNYCFHRFVEILNAYFSITIELLHTGNQQKINKLIAKLFDNTEVEVIQPLEFFLSKLGDLRNKKTSDSTEKQDNNNSILQISPEEFTVFAKPWDYKNSEIGKLLEQQNAVINAIINARYKIKEKKITSNVTTDPEYIDFATLKIHNIDICEKLKCYFSSYFQTPQPEQASGTSANGLTQKIESCMKVFHENNAGTNNSQVSNDIKEIVSRMISFKNQLKEFQNVLCEKIAQKTEKNNLFSYLIFLELKSYIDTLEKMINMNEMCIPNNLDK
ncbi:hypothetical protein EDEG_02044 [Edhazardia aedis USNM 41457]|uniref:Uncharacterized protein n=1 Tax=Edhazardia aedis (strain USNM 41457) TaxID=1003232 RepID=J9DQQ3_EDHAE|nr:hypothetical protein EDEG_02044 [Edhazardia aedis USNM 41457]|eukprot:EJW03647.1 hypothetical protein EDEG_02044 [Edhazardia aedis USNM 41457]